ncbi:MAG: hypothetical protein WDA05_05180 [Candidatus Methanomethylophilaceae archaeon]|nr:hypothetical protein [Candidatus Methanomethylophilaceae archaeon]MDD2779496.1 hypothetical protein [Candidatus Methanomethylophilaceae archaeon]MDD3128183.1 hypothetical protein [Candidatus Methanomethylophilaceae archaeon]MDD4119863.1 hypothetical protein [Candidatus Methanomethylophilaceae archaeon]MDD4455079.1 hypothetical protein [Candidatus Methanomethylophilaceae archaeon]
MSRLIMAAKGLLLASAATFIILSVLTLVGVILIILNGGRV